MRNWFQYGSTMAVLIGWIAITWLWAGGLQEKVVNNEKSNYRLSTEVKCLTKELSETNKLLYEIKGKME